MQRTYQKIQNAAIFPALGLPIETDSWVEIDSQALAHNIAQYKSIINTAQLAVVVKSNAYGNGIKEIAALCEYDANVNYFCTVNIAEALYLRGLGIKKPILVLSIVQNNLEQAIVEEIDLVVFDYTLASRLNALGKQLQKKVYVHIKVDTGLSRLGLHIDAAYDFILQLQSLPFIIIRGMFTHFADSEKANSSFVIYQMQQFSLLLERLGAVNIHIPIQHTSCSAAISAYRYHYNLVRVGIGAYGLWPSSENKNCTQQLYPQFNLKPVLTWKTRILQIKEIPAGSFVGYDCTYTTNTATKIAVISVGYWDGYDRQLSNKAYVVINNQKAPVIGRIAMNMTMINITGLNVGITDEVILLGAYPGITADDLANLCDTINYEIVARINPLLNRIVI